MSLILLLALWAVSPPTQAQHSAAVAYAQPLRMAVATHALELRLQALADEDAVVGARHADADDPDDEQFEPLLALFAGSLAQADPGLLKRIEQPLRMLDQRADTGHVEALEKAIPRVQKDLAAARKLLVPEALARQADFRAVVIAELAVSRFGFGEAYEDAAKGEAGAYLLAWLTLQRVSALWDDLKPDLVSADAELEPILKELAAAMPSAQKPAELHDPEDVEVAALDVVFALERNLPRPLLVRGFEPQWELARQQADQACLAAANGQTRLATENALAGQGTYDAELGATVAVVAPALAVDVNTSWVRLAGLSGAVGATPEACTDIKEALTRVGKALGLATRMAD